MFEKCFFVIIADFSLKIVGALATVFTVFTFFVVPKWVLKIMECRCYSISKVLGKNKLNENDIMVFCCLCSLIFLLWNMFYVFILCEMLFINIGFCYNRWCYCKSRWYSTAFFWYICVWRLFSNCSWIMLLHIQK